MGGAVEALLIGAVATAIAWATWYFQDARRLRRALVAAKAWPIGELPENATGRVIGEVQPLERVLESPLTGRACVYYVVTVDVRRSNDRWSSWRTVITKREGAPFLLHDASGRAIVDPAGAEVVLASAVHSRSGTFDDATPAEEAFLARYDHASTTWGLSGIRFTEAVIAPGAFVAVLGAGVREPDPAARPAEGYRSGPPTRLRLTSSRQHPLVIGDDPSTVQR
jgi:hypothetical protein